MKKDYNLNTTIIFWIYVIHLSVKKNKNYMTNNQIYINRNTYSRDIADGTIFFGKKSSFWIPDSPSMQNMLVNLTLLWNYIIILL